MLLLLITWYGPLLYAGAIVKLWGINSFFGATPTGISFDKVIWSEREDLNL